MVLRPTSQPNTLACPALIPTTQAVSQVFEAQALEAIRESPPVSTSISEHFAGLADPRKSGMVAHKLLDMIMITVCAVICGANNWVEVVTYGQSKQAWLKQFLELPHGIASHDTFARVFALLSAEGFQACFAQWMQSVFERSEGEVIAIDGKRLRHSYDSANSKAAIHMVSAWAQANHVVLGQVKTDDKSNEITAIPKLLDLLDIRGCIVTIDAMGCQKAIAAKINAGGGDYVLSLKGNHSQLHQDVMDYFSYAERCQFKDIAHDYYETLDSGHGRVEVRRYWTIANLEWLEHKEAWAGLTVIGKVQSERHSQDQVSLENRYYLLSLENDAKQFARAARGHWGIENTLHWSLDVTFREDDSRIRQGEAAENFAVVRHLALSLLKQERTAKVGLAAKRFKAALDTDYLLKVLRVQ